MAEWKKGWKVITRSRESAASGMRVSYPKNKVVGRPKKCGPLAVFRTRANARSYRNENLIWKVVKCVYIPSKHDCLWFHLGKYRVEESRYLPRGTALAEKVKCLE